MDPTPISAYKLGRILRKDEQWVEQLKDMMTEEEKIQLQDILHGTQNIYGGTKAPSATKLYEFEDTIFERYKKKEEEYANKQTKQIEELTRQVNDLYKIIEELRNK
jgi:hypothetical protein